MERNSKSISKIINNSYSPENIITNDKFTRFFINNVDKKNFIKLNKRPMSKEYFYNKQKNELLLENKNLFYKKRNMNGILASNSSIFRQKKKLPPFIKTDISERYENINNDLNHIKNNNLILHFTQIKPIKIIKSKFDQYKKDSKLIKKVNVNRNNIHLFSRKNNRKDIEMENYKNYTFNKNSSFYNEKINSLEKDKKSMSFEKYTLSYKDKNSVCYKEKCSTILLEEKNKINNYELNISTKLPFSKISLKNINEFQKPIFIFKDLSKVFHNTTIRLAMKKPILKLKLKE
jgi:hypothetical protein